MAEQIARFKPGENLTVYAKKTIRAGRLVIIKGRTAQGSPEVEEAGAKAKPTEILGVTQRSADESLPATSVDRLVEIVGEGAVARIEASAEIKPGEPAQATTEGRVGPGSEVPIGICLNTAKNGEYAEILLRFT